MFKFQRDRLSTHYYSNTDIVQLNHLQSPNRYEILSQKISVILGVKSLSIS